MNPFIWDDIGSADPAVYDEYCSFIGDAEITVENSIDFAREYMKSIKYADLTAAFNNIDINKWMDGCKRYLASDHKGADSSTLD